MPPRKPLGYYANLWSEYLTTGGNPKVELLRMEDFVAFFRAGISALREAGQLADVRDLDTPEGKDLVVGLGLFINQTGGYDRWKILERKLREEVESLSAQLVAAQESTTDIGDRVTRLEDELERATAYATDLEAKLQAAEARAAEAERQATAAAGIPDDSARLLQEREAEFEARVAAVTALQEQLQAAQTQVADRDGRIQSLEAELARLREEFDAYVAETEKIRAEHAELKRRVSFAEAEMRKAQEIMADRVGASEEDREEVRGAVLHGISAERAAEVIAKEWRIPGSLPDEVPLDGLEDAQTKLEFRFGPPMARQELLQEVQTAMEGLASDQARFADLRGRPDHKPLTPQELLELLRLDARLQAWERAGILLSRTVATGQMSPSP